MPPSKKRLLKPKEVSLDSPPKEETPNIELPIDENKVFDVDDDVGTSTIADLSVPSEVEEEEVKSNNVWCCNTQECCVFVIRNGIDIPLWSTRSEEEGRGDKNEELKIMKMMCF